MRFWPLCTPTWAFSVAVCACVLHAATVSAEDCGDAKIVPRSPDPVAVFAEGRAYAEHGRYEEARAMYLWLLGRDLRDREAMLALARLDAWGGCYARAEERYAVLVEHNPHDIEARAGLIDVMLWMHRWAEARSLVDAGLRLDPKAPELWQRRAHLLHWTGDNAGAIEAADRAQALAPQDEDIRQLRDQLFTGQARTSLRGDFFFLKTHPRVYPKIYTADLQVLQQFHKLELGIDAQFFDRDGPAPQGTPTNTQPVHNQAVLDSLYTASAVYHADGGSAVGLNLGFGAPARAIPRLETKGWFLAQITSRWSGSFAYSFWQYRADKTVHIMNPAIGYGLTDAIHLELRAWVSHLLLQPTAGSIEPMSMKPAAAHGRWVAAAGLRGTWQALTPLTFGAAYTYGAQLDQVTATVNFVTLESHVIGLFADWLVRRDVGLQPMLGFERRMASTGTLALIYTAELASYFRW